LIFISDRIDGTTSQWAPQSEVNSDTVAVKTSGAVLHRFGDHGEIFRNFLFAADLLAELVVAALSDANTRSSFHALQAAVPVAWSRNSFFCSAGRN
jgi:hypothetical protein